MKGSKMFVTRYNHLRRFGVPPGEARIGAHLFLLLNGHLSKDEAELAAYESVKLLNDAMIQIGIAARHSANSMRDLQAER